MINGKVVFTGKSNSGRAISIRYPRYEDAAAMSAYINTLSDEHTFITYQGEQMSVEDEQEFLKKELRNIEEKKAVFLLVFSSDTLIGISGIDLGSRTSHHVGTFGISIAEAYRGDGIGKLLMETIHKEAETQLPELKIVSLGLFEGNDLARTMYEAFGYQEYGRLPEGVFFRGEYIDHIEMYKKLR